jgi:cytochrome c-type biogenesis protein CcmH/NrfG
VVFAVSGTCFGLLVGWILGSQSSRPVPAPVPPAASAAAQPPGERQPPPLDVQRAADLEQQAKARPDDAMVRAELGNVYYDAERFDLAIPWYEAALRLEGRNVDVSTDLALCYYFTSDVDKALRQIDFSLSIDPRHTKTLLNQGIIRAFGKKDLDGAAESWEKVVQIAPESEEARRARQGLDGLRSAHPDSGRGAGSGGGTRQ